MSKIRMKAGTLLSPLPPVLVSCSDGEKDNLITRAWTGILNSDPPKTYISVRPERFSHGIIERSREFVINLPSSKLLRAIDLCGVKSGRDVDKFDLCKLDKEKAEHVSCPVVAQSEISIECRVSDIIRLGSHDMFMADILGVDVNEELIDEKGKIHFPKASLMAYVHGEYFALGKRIGSFGCSVRKKKKR